MKNLHIQILTLARMIIDCINNQKEQRIVFVNTKEYYEVIIRKKKKDKSNSNSIIYIDEFNI